MLARGVGESTAGQLWRLSCEASALVGQSVSGKGGGRKEERRTKSGEGKEKIEKREESKKGEGERRGRGDMNFMCKVSPQSRRRHGGLQCPTTR